MELTSYAIDKDNRLVYVGHNDKGYLVWGIGEHGLRHGVGAYLKRHDDANKGYPAFKIDEPTYREIEEYYNSLDKLFRKDGG